ncbi:MAG: DUF3365 domain-containing protein [Campylobacterales bacterium]|nr:DUF3365 domain-containing protein [Campylobacterales bacterium]
MKRLLLTTTFVAAALLANPYESKPEEIAAVKATGQKASAALLKSLGGNLQKHLQSGGPMEAFGFCSDHAYTMTEAVDQSMGSDVSVKRISLKYRNPVNAPQGSEKAILESLETLQANGVVLPDEVVEVIGDGVYKYYKPLLINKEACLKCHGDIDKLPELAKAIRERYPEDKATGYRMNDLRGAVVVTVKH